MLPWLWEASWMVMVCCWGSAPAVTGSSAALPEQPLLGLGT